MYNYTAVFYPIRVFVLLLKFYLGLDLYKCMYVSGVFQFRVMPKIILEPFTHEDNSSHTKVTGLNLKSCHHGNFYSDNF